jgi:hypothetical protein
VTLKVAANDESIVATFVSPLLRREKKKKKGKKKFKESLAATKCGHYLDQIAATLKVAANEGSIAATFVSPLLRRDRKKKSKSH